jgi:hypothetical protein
MRESNLMCLAIAIDTYKIERRQRNRLPILKYDYLRISLVFLEFLQNEKSDSGAAPYPVSLNRKNRYSNQSVANIAIFWPW